MLGQGRELLSRQIVEVQVVEAGARGGEQKALAIGQVLTRRIVVGPAVGPRVANDNRALAAGGITGRELHDVLTAIRAIEGESASIRRPAHVVHVVSDHVVGERLPVTDIEARALLRGHVVHVQVDDRVGGTGFRIRLDIECSLHLGLIHAEVVVLHRGFVEAVVGESGAGGVPPHRGRLSQLFAVHPRRGAVLDAFRFAAVGGKRDFVGARRIAHVEIAIAVECLARRVGREREGRLPSALDRSSASAITRRRRAGRFGGTLGGDIVAPPLAVEHVLEALAIRRPRDGQRAHFYAARNVARHPRVLLVSRHCTQAILGLRAGRERDRKRQREQ